MIDARDRKWIERDGVRYDVRWVYDDDPDLSYLGEYIAEWKPGCIDREEQGDLENDREYRYFLPTNYKADAKDPEDRKYAMADYKRMEAHSHGDWYMMGCLVTAYIDGTEVGHAGLWGIESDSGEAYLTTIENDLIAEARGEIPASAERMAKVLDKITTLPPSGDTPRTEEGKPNG